MGRKYRLYTPEIAETILERLEDGEGLATICADEGMPSRGAVRNWVEDDIDGFAARYARAREAGLHLLADEILQIADDGSNDTYKDKDGYEKVNQDVVTRSRLRVDSRKWILSKLIPKTYGDKLDLNHGGEVALRNMPDDRVESRLADLLRKAGAVSLIGGKGTAEAPPED